MRTSRNLLPTLGVTFVLGLALVSITACGGDSSEATASESVVQARDSACKVPRIRGTVLGIESGIETTRRRLLAALKGRKFLPSPEPGAKRQSIRVAGLLALKTVEENAATIRAELKSC